VGIIAAKAETGKADDWEGMVEAPNTTGFMPVVI